MSQSAFIVEVPEAEPLIASLRERFDPSARLGVPAHVTILFPFMSIEFVTAQVLDAARAAVAESGAFEFALARVERFPSVTYLAPDPPAPFVRLTDNLVRRFPAFPPYSGRFGAVVPHSTVADGHSADADVTTDLNGILKRHGPIESTCRAVTLIEDSSGRWRKAHSFPLAPTGRRLPGQATE